MVLGCGTVSRRVASSSCTTVVPEGVPPESEPELALEMELEPVLNLETVPQLELEVEPEPQVGPGASGAQQQLSSDHERLDMLEHESQATLLCFRTKSGATVSSAVEFLIEAKLSRYSHQLITQGGLQLNEIKAITEDQLLGLGVTKPFHRLRFLREARQMTPIVAKGH